MLTRQSQPGALAKPCAEQTQTRCLASIDGAESPLAWRHQLESISRHIAHVTQFRLHPQNPGQTAPSPAAMTITPATSSPSSLGRSTISQATAASPGALNMPEFGLDSGASAHIANARDQRGRATLRLVEPRTPDMNKYPKVLAAQKRVKTAERKKMDAALEDAVLNLGMHPDGANLTTLLKWCEAWISTELPPELHCPNFERESMLLQSEMMGNALVARTGIRSPNAQGALRAAAAGYVAARQKRSPEKFEAIFRTVHGGSAARFLMGVLSDLGIEGLRFFQDFGTYLTATENVTNANTIKAYRTICLGLMRSAMELFSTSTVYAQAHRCYSWAFNEADTQRVIAHYMQARQLTRATRILPATGQAQQQTTTKRSPQQANDIYVVRQIILVAGYMRECIQSRLSPIAAGPADFFAPVQPAVACADLADEPDTHCSESSALERLTGSSYDPVSTSGSPQTADHATSEPEQACALDVLAQDYPHSPIFSDLNTMLTEDHPSAAAPASVFTDLDLTYFDAPVAGNKRSAEQAFGPDRTYTKPPQRR
jgi:hypothetical protein